MTAITRHGTNKQGHLPKRISIVRTKSSLRQRRKVKKDQSTLTQIGWATPSFTGVDEDSEVSDPEIEEARPRKRRKIGAKLTEEELKQATLTQIGWPFDDNENDSAQDEDEDEDEASNSDESSEDSLNDMTGEGADHEVSHTPRLLDEEHDLADASRDTQISPEHPRPYIRYEASASSDSNASRSPSATSPSQHSPISHTTSPRRRPLAMPSPELGRSPPQPADATSSPFKTPQKPLRREVPSSQSPATTPLSTISASPSRRTPLREISIQEWSQRDNTPTPKRRNLVADSEEANGDKENAYLASDDEEEDLAAVKPQPMKLFEQSPRSHTANSSNDILDHNSLAMLPPTIPPSHPAHHYFSTPAAYEAQSMQSKSSQDALSITRHFPTDSEVKARSLQENIYGSTTFRTHQHNTLRSSQATTVDITQQSPLPPASQPISSSDTRPRLASPDQPHSPPSDSQAVMDTPELAGFSNTFLNQLPPSPPPVFESQFPYSMFSHYSDDGLGMRYEYTEDSQERHLAAGEVSP